MRTTALLLCTLAIASAKFRDNNIEHEYTKTHFHVSQTRMRQIFRKLHNSKLGNPLKRYPIEWNPSLKRSFYPEIRKFRFYTGLRAYKYGVTADKGPAYRTYDRNVPTLPENFSMAANGPKQCQQLFSVVGQQGSCGSCWAFSGTTVVSMALCYQTNGVVNKLVSPQQMLTCGITYGQNGCAGWFPTNAMQWVVNNPTYIDTHQPHRGLVTGTGSTFNDTGYYSQNLTGLFGKGYTESCRPYLFSNDSFNPRWDITKNTGMCKHVCDDGTIHKSTTFTNGMSVDNVFYIDDTDYDNDDFSDYDDPAVNPDIINHNYDNLKHYIQKYGPVTATFPVYDDLLAYTEDAEYIEGAPGIYRLTWAGRFTGTGHAVVLTGWGRQNGVEYWLARNSWGNDWGIRGDFKVALDNGIGFPGDTIGLRICDGGEPNGTCGPK